MPAFTVHQRGTFGESAVMVCSCPRSADSVRLCRHALLTRINVTSSCKFMYTFPGGTTEKLHNVEFCYNIIILGQYKCYLNTHIMRANRSCLSLTTRPFRALVTKSFFAFRRSYWLGL